MIVSTALLAKFFIGFAIVALTLISFKIVKTWFRSRQKIKESDKNNIAFTLKEHMSNGEYAVCQGIFNTSSEELLEGVRMQGKIDKDLEAIHAGRPMVIYN